MKAPKNVNVELLKNNSIRMSLVENVTNYPENFSKRFKNRKTLTTCYKNLDSTITSH